MARKLGDEALAVWALRMVTHGLVEEGRIAEAQTFATEAFEAATRLGTPFETGTALGTLGIVRRAECDYAAAAQALRQSSRAAPRIRGALVPRGSVGGRRGGRGAAWQSRESRNTGDGGTPTRE